MGVYWGAVKDRAIVHYNEVRKMRRNTTILKRSNQKGREELEKCPKSKVKKVFQEEKNGQVIQGLRSGP